MDYRIPILVTISLILVSSTILFAESAGVLNLTTKDESITTGIFGFTVGLCNSKVDCGNYICFDDFDGTSTSPNSGWCNQSVVTNCVHNSRSYATGTYYCRTNTTYHLCTTGAWGSQTSCSGSDTCTVDSTDTSSPCAGTVTTTTLASGGGGGGSSGSTSTTTTLSNTPSINISGIIADFSVEQGKSIGKTLKVKNDGKFSLGNIVLSVAGIDSTWFSVSPASIATLDTDKESTFTVDLTIPAAAEVKEYAATAEVTTNESSAKDSVTFKMKVLPSGATVQEDILPKYNSYIIILEEFNNTIIDLITSRKNVTELEKIYAAMNTRLLEINTSLEGGDYFQADQLLGDVESLVQQFRDELAIAQLQPADNLLFILGILAITIISSAILYLFWPYRKSDIRSIATVKAPSDFELKYGYKNPNIIQKIISKLRRKSV